MPEATPESKPESSPATRTLYQHLPNFVLLRILKDVMASDTVFHIDKLSCTTVKDEKGIGGIQDKPLTLNAKRQAKIYPKLRSAIDKAGNGVLGYESKVNKPISKDTRSISSKFYNQQRVHITDWAFIHSIDRRTRDIGRLAFFQRKSFSMSYQLIPTIDKGGVPFLQDVEVRRIALENITDLTLTDFSAVSPADFAQLPRRIQLFRNLKYCTCLFKQLVDWEPDVLELGKAPKMPQELLELLVCIGLPGDVTFYLGCLAHDEPLRKKIARMQENVYPWLKIKAKIMLEVKKGGIAA